MSENDYADRGRCGTEQMIVDILSKAGKPYLTVNQIRNRLPSGELRRLGLNRKRSGSAQVLGTLKRAIGACAGEGGDRLGGGLRIYRGPKAVYIGIWLSDEALILEKLGREPGLSVKALGNRLPLLKRDYIATLNRLTASGRVHCTFNDAWRPILRSVKPASMPRKVYAGDHKTLFKEAYDRIGKGRGFVRIHRIRAALNWTDETFDGLLKELMAAYVIELHGGDPSTLSENEIRQSYVDEGGTLYITLSWWGEDHEK